MKLKELFEIIKEDYESTPYKDIWGTGEVIIEYKVDEILGFGSIESRIENAEILNNGCLFIKGME